MIFGTLGGGGTIGGEVTVAMAVGPAILGPEAQGIIPGTLVIKRGLKLNAGATFNVLLDSGAAQRG